MPIHQKNPSSIVASCFNLFLICIFSLGGGVLSGQSLWKVGSVEAAVGQLRSGYLIVPPGSDGETRIPITLLYGSKPGPTLVTIAGNHGYEYPPVLASQRLITSLDPKKISGKVILVHVANMPSFLKRTIYYSPIDGKNLNRVFPGRKDGTISERIAHVITQEVINRADYLVDLHCGDGNESLRPYSYWMPIGNPKVDEASRQMALAFGLDHIVIDRGRPKDPNASLYCSNTAATRGKPALTIESGGMGVAFEEGDIAPIEKGILNLMRHLKMIEGQAAMIENPKWYEQSEVLRFPENLADKAGIFFPQAKKEQRVEKGALLGYVTNFFGEKIFELRAPFAGEVFYILCTPPISAGEPLAFIAGNQH